MAAITNALATGSTTNGTSYVTSSFTPAAGDYLIAFVLGSDVAIDGTITDSQSLGWTKIGSVVSNTNNRLITYISNTAAAASSMTVTWDCTGDPASGAVISVMRLSGSDGRVRQFATASGLAAVAPSVTLAKNCLTSSAIAFGQTNLTNPHGMTAPSGYVSRNGAGYNTPTVGLNACSKNSGETSNVVTAAALSATDWTTFGVELYSTGISTQTLTPSLNVDADSFFAPTITNKKTLTPSLFTNASSFFATVVTAAITLSAPAYADGDTFYSPTIAQGGQASTLSPALFSNSNSFPTASVQAGAVTLAPVKYADVDSFYVHGLVRGAINLTASRYSDSDSFYPATVSPGPRLLIAGLLNDTDNLYIPTVTRGQINLLPALIIDGDTFYSASINHGATILPQETIRAEYIQYALSAAYEQPIMAAAYTTHTIEATI